MILAIIRKIGAIVLLSGLFLFTNAQSFPDPSSKESKPYRILTSGRQVTVKSSKDIKSVMVWTASGHRIVEQREINASSYSFTVSTNEKIVFLMLELTNEKRFTEKIGVQ
jgi:hypothetical protein